MVDRSMNGATSASSLGRWKLNDDTAQETQGLVASHFGHLPVAKALFLQLPDGAGGQWLTALRQVVKVSDATGSREDTGAVALAFTWSGLAQMKLPAEALASFSAPFREGMHQADRQRRLRDDPALGTVIAGGALWSGNVRDTSSPTAAAASTPLTVHCVLLLYASDDAALDTQVAQVKAVLQAQQVSISHRLQLSLRTDSRGIFREHFGFADGISQPVPTGPAVIPPSGPDAQAQLRWHGVKAGEILLGHENIHNELAPGPVVSRAAAGAFKLRAAGAPQGFVNLGLNGSYLVIRELRQDVAAFWQSMDHAANILAEQGARRKANGQAPDCHWVAEHIVGRSIDGDVLVPPVQAEQSSTTPPDNGVPMTNNFGYAHTDVLGMGCPLGSHIRRANPRDSLPSRDGAKPDLAAAEQLLSAANAHRILRRGRKFGPDIVAPRHDDGQQRGLLFMCLNSDLVRQFEFIQQTWLLNPNFATLFDETDPLMGLPGKISIPAYPLRWRPDVQTYVQMAGGEYFFLPSMPALDFLAALS